MHKNMEDTRPQKAINLRGTEVFVCLTLYHPIDLGAKVVKYEDPKRGPALELTWSRRNKELKRYHVINSPIPRPSPYLSSSLVIRSN